MYEQLPTPYGLVRYGVAPDHPEVKNCQSTFAAVARSPNFTYIGNVCIGVDISLPRLKPHYDALLFAYGASRDKVLGIPGEELRGVYSAREFVGWYNGLSEFSDLAPDLGRGAEAVVIGQGNVAMDVARILLSPVDVLRQTDITEKALEVLGRSRVRSVKVVGRRGALQAAFTVKEVRELMHIQDLAFERIDTSLFPPDIKKLPRVQRRIAEVLQKGTEARIQNSEKRWGLEFLKAPKAMHASDSTHISSITFAHQAFSPDTDPFSKSASVVPTGEESTLPADMAFRSVGYKSASIPGLDELGVPFDTKLGIIPNDPYGRVITPSAGPGSLTAGHVSGLYCAGWVKRGPTGVIASTMEDAFTSADVIACDWESDVPFLNTDSGEDRSTGLGWAGIREEVVSKGVRPLSWSDWERIDELEVARGQKLGKPREKFESVREMLKVLDA
ncbi:FAD/NAD(P)-binding domain-containing protein [Lophiostoma macrostomum CBS 122681]|uniref:NADPH:adrenodoxin oxidoreductase, mitochondrial n=1 Tax=Lophiostoma macrostomum CBS 122681 TaxID=1314788 RepID=A0A6A6THV1_9PLEO|nr:FAD/NAD(P)-binding domain-containing protein [Lophiostoma macrostomum CBS 122681]